jgi:hypothetical protein
MHLASDWPDHVPFAKTDVERALTRAASGKAELLALEEAVSDIRWQAREEIFTASVRGTAHHPYTVKIGFHGDQTDGYAIDGQCTCPMLFLDPGGGTALELTDADIEALFG